MRLNVRPRRARRSCWKRDAVGHGVPRSIPSSRAAIRCHQHRLWTTRCTNDAGTAIWVGCVGCRKVGFDVSLRTYVQRKCRARRRVAMFRGNLTSSEGRGERLNPHANRCSRRGQIARTLHDLAYLVVGGCRLTAGSNDHPALRSRCLI